MCILMYNNKIHMMEDVLIVHNIALSLEILEITKRVLRPSAWIHLAVNNCCELNCCRRPSYRARLRRFSTCSLYRLNFLYHIIITGPKAVS